LPSLSPRQPLRIGEILIEQGVLSEQQVFEIVQAQKRSALPFGVLAERMFDVTVGTIEEAWVEQYVRQTGEIDLDQQRIDADALRLIHRRQAWQFEVLPLHFDAQGDLVMAASRARLARAVTFVANSLQPVVFFRVAERVQLQDFLRTHYPMPEVSREILLRAQLLGTPMSSFGDAAV
jgi:hypothetical protein